MQKIYTPIKRVMLAFAIVMSGAVGIASQAAAAEETAIVAGGCFWCVESDFDHVPGVLKTTSGYIGGESPNPTYKSVSAGGSGYLEAVEIIFDPDKISYASILDIFWRSVDPTDDGGQFCDRGESYKTAIFTTSDTQKTTAENSKAELNASGLLNDPVVTPIRSAMTFYPAEDYHQNYAEINPIRYSFYRFNCGRDAKVEELWGDQAHRGIMEH
ncbi:peptide-methionine (S)-S-oxide reductase MsrA [Sneathiella sp. HT1-7]|uniref:peptide-methionine (S)-S-oxide reductase MsrA n=1 Tax=Sneathiella sp. HT1-7 TaxID=2887192 RepID=UPI001D14DF27|nr:peptide-methionine (S)-S-oxide reductase MsrA [Sneathiella sp. HT1-7]MCC3304410.1 peptide-methionine (S)-S-oxide reductase MsrA [Sneathiella sp. HT1-7]